MIVLGIDPGTAAVGYGIVEAAGAAPRHIAHGCLTTLPDITLPDRLLRIHDGIAALVDRHAPDVVAVERIYFSRNAQTAIAVGHGRGVILLVAAEHRLPVMEATPGEVKQAVTGSGSADKRQVQRMVRVVLGLDAEPRPDDAADALAIAIWASSAAAIAVAAAGTAPLLDRAAVAPVAAGPSPYERAVREALRAERESAAGKGSVR